MPESNSRIILPLPWQRNAWGNLEELISSGRMPHALLITGPGEIGKSQFARAVAQRLLCASPIGSQACGQCKQCLLFAAGHHPDFFNLIPEEPGKAIKVDEVRALGEFANRTAQQGGWRVALVAPAEAMNLNAANAFLKTLEEPGPSTLLLLVSQQPAAVLATVRSRCRLLKMTLPHRDEVLSWLRETVGDDPGLEDALNQAGGRPLRAARLIQGDLLEQLRQFTDLLESLESGSLSAIGAAKKIQALSDVETVPWFQQHIYQRIRKSVDLDIAGSRLAFLFLDRLTHSKRLLASTGNPNRQLLWEELLMDWQAAITADRRQGLC